MAVCAPVHVPGVGTQPGGVSHWQQGTSTMLHHVSIASLWDAPLVLLLFCYRSSQACLGPW